MGDCTTTDRIAKAATMENCKDAQVYCKCSGCLGNQLSSNKVTLAKMATVWVGECFFCFFLIFIEPPRLTIINPVEC